MSEATDQVAAELAASILSEAAAAGDTTAAEVLQQQAVVQQQPVAAPEVPASTPDAAPPAAPAVEQEAFELPDFTPQLPDDLQEMLDEPDFEEDAAAEVASELEEGEYEYTDPEVAKKLRALEKKNQFLEARLVETNRRKWVAENLRAYPLLNSYAKEMVEGIQATSRRAFAREAARLNETYTRALKPALDDIAKAKAALKQEVVAEARQEVQAAWGAPVGDHAPSGAAEIAAEIAAARKRGFGETIKTMLGQKPVI